MTGSKLTADEAVALASVHNLADAHTRQGATTEELHAIVGQLPELFVHANIVSQAVADRRGFQKFMSLSGQSLPADGWYLPQYSASVATEVLANALQEKCATVGLIEPTFDNIADILRRNGMALVPMALDTRESYYTSVISAVVEHSGAIDAVFIVNPNNPTGQVLGSEELRQICRACKRDGVVLMIDSSFRLYDDRAVFDQYAILDETQVDYITIEDTGKTWATLDMKLAYVRASAAFRPALVDVHNDLLLNVSPFVSLLIEAYSDLYRRLGLNAIRKLVTRNRRVLRERVTEVGGLELSFPESRISVELLTLPLGMNSREVAERLAISGTAVLSGEAFFWSNPALGRQFIRVALARSEDYFDNAVSSLVNSWRHLEKGDPL